METVIAGAVVGAIAGAVLGRWRGRGLGVSYGLLVTGLVWAAVWVVVSNRVEGMGGMPYAVAGGMAFWFLVVPAGAAVLVLERRRTRGDRRL